MTNFMFLGALRALVFAIVNLRPLTGARLTANANQSGVDLYDPNTGGKALAGIEGAYVQSAFFQIVKAFCDKFGLTAASAAAFATNGNMPTPALLAGVIETALSTNAPLATFITNHGGAFLSALRPAPATSATAALRQILLTSGVIGTPLCTVSIAPATIGRGTESGAGKIFNMLKEIGITNGISTMEITTAMLTSIDTTDAVNLNTATVATIQNPFATAAPTPPNVNVTNPTDAVPATIVAAFRAQPNAAAAQAEFAAKFDVALPTDKTSVAKIADYVATLTVADMKA